MKKLIASNFELDLTPYKITDTEENSWFSDSFTSKITYPFDIDLTDELDVAFGFLSSDNTSPETLYKVKYFENDRIHDAEFEILEIEGRKVQCSYEYGLEEFPSWNKKLAELPLHNFLLEGISIYDYAKNMIDKTYPEVDFCFPAIHTDQFTNDEEIWETFEKTINNYRNGAFVKNNFDSGDLVSYNRNIMQPVPFFIYLIKAGLAGFTLEGDVLTDELLLNNAAYSPVEYFRRRVPPELSAIIMGNQFKEVHPDSYPVNGMDWGIFEHTLVISKIGKYRIQGNFSIQVRSASEPMGIFRNIKLNGVELGPLPSGGNLNNYFELDFECSSVTDTLVFYATSKISDDYIIMNFDVVLLDEYDQFGQSIPIIENEDKIDLTKAVPDMTFGEYFTMVCNWRNYDYYIDGNRVIMNRIQNQMGFENMISLEQYEIKDPLRKAQQGISFLLKFQDLEEFADDKVYEYKYASVFHNKAGISLSDYQINKKTNTIEINALPLPLLNRNGVETAHCFEYSSAKVYAVIYTGLTGGKNKAQDPAPILMPAIHSTNWNDWIVFRINSQPYKWLFKALEADIIGLNVKSKIYAYKNVHYIKTLVRTQIEPGIYEVEIETESRK